MNCGFISNPTVKLGLSIHLDRRGFVTEDLGRRRRWGRTAGVMKGSLLVNKFEDIALENSKL